MTNWCDNSIVLSHRDESILERARIAFNNECLFNEFVPIPTDLFIADINLICDEEKTQLNKDIESNIKKYGYKDWLDFCIDHWGCSGDIINNNNKAELYEASLILNFYTYWNPPLKFYEKMIKFGFVIDAYYYEKSLEFAGMWFNGELFHFYDLDKPIPKELKVIFNIPQNLMENNTDDTDDTEIDENNEEDEEDEEDS
jgi:hypothetical protein